MDQLQSYGPIGFFVIFLLLSLTGILGSVVRGLAGLLDAIFRLVGL